MRKLSLAWFSTFSFSAPGSLAVTTCNDDVTFKSSIVNRKSQRRYRIKMRTFRQLFFFVLLLCLTRWYGWNQSDSELVVHSLACAFTSATCFFLTLYREEALARDQLWRRPFKFMQNVETLFIGPGLPCALDRFQINLLHFRKKGKFQWLFEAECWFRSWIFSKDRRKLPRFKRNRWTSFTNASH